MFLLKDVLVVSSNDPRALPERRGVGVKPLEVFNILLTVGGGVKPFIDDASMAHVLLVDGGEGFVLHTLFKAFE